MIKLLLPMLLLMSFNAFSECYEQITQNGSYSSRVFKLEADEFSEYDKLTPKVAAQLVDTLLRRETSCYFEKVGGSLKDISCTKMPRSGTTCEVPTSLGYFIVHRNSYGSFDHSIMYTRWD